MDATKDSNDRIKEFKKSKGKEFQDAHKKRKFGDPPNHNEGPPAKKFLQNGNNFNNKDFGNGKSFGNNKNFGNKSFGNNKNFGNNKSFGNNRNFGNKKSFGNGNNSFNNKFKANGASKQFGKDGEKPDWREVRKETKERKKNRKTKSVGGEEKFDTFSQAIKLWEELRHANCKKERRKELCNEVANLFTGNVQTWIRQAAGIRMVEHLIAYGDVDLRAKLFEELNSKKLMLQSMKDSHSHRFLLKILKHGTPQQREVIIGAMEGKVVRLAKHSTAAKVVEAAFSEFGTAPQRSAMLQEFFGPRFTYFKEEGVRNLTDVLAKYPDKKADIMKQMQAGLQPVLSKGILSNALILSLLKDYMTYSDQEEKSAVIESVEDALLAVMHSRDGSRLAMMCLWYGTAKQRKSILKTFKDHLFDTATWDHAYLVLLAALDCVDDIALLKKAILEPLMYFKEKLVESEIGTRVLRYMALGRDPTYFHPDILNLLKMGDNNPYTKKPADLKRKEIVQIISGSLEELIMDNVADWSVSKQWCLFIGPAIGVLPKSSQKKKVMEAVAKHWGAETEEGAEKLIDVAHANKTLNFIISSDKQNKVAKMPLFSLLLIQHAQENIVSWLSCNRGCFLAVRLIETGIGRVIVKVRQLVKDNMSVVKAQKCSGAEILLKKMKETEDIEESDVEEEEEEVEKQTNDEIKKSVEKMETEEDGDDEKDDVEQENDDDAEDGDDEEDDAEEEGEDDDEEDGEEEGEDDDDEEDGDDDEEDDDEEMDEK